MALSLRWPPEISAKRSRLMAALSYLGILCFIPLLFSHGDSFVAFHARQGLVLWGVSVLALIMLTIPGLGWFFKIASSLIPLLSIIGLISALLLQSWKFPLIGDVAERL